MVEVESGEENGVCCLIYCRISAGYVCSKPSSLTSHNNKPEITQIKMHEQKDRLRGKNIKGPTLGGEM